MTADAGSGFRRTHDRDVAGAGILRTYGRQRRRADVLTAAADHDDLAGAALVRLPAAARQPEEELLLGHHVIAAADVGQDRGRDADVGNPELSHIRSRGK